jgi:hypothetical protein
MAEFRQSVNLEMTEVKNALSLEMTFVRQTLKTLPQALAFTLQQQTKEQSETTSSQAPMRHPTIYGDVERSNEEDNTVDCNLDALKKNCSPTHQEVSVRVSHKLSSPRPWSGSDVKYCRGCGQGTTKVGRATCKACGLSSWISRENTQLAHISPTDSVSKDVAELQQEAEILRRTIANKNEELQRVSAENGVKKKKWLEVLERVNKIGAMPRGLYSFFSHLLCIFT